MAQWFRNGFHLNDAHTAVKSYYSAPNVPDGSLFGNLGCSHILHKCWSCPHCNFPLHVEGLQKKDTKVNISTTQLCTILLLEICLAAEFTVVPPQINGAINVMWTKLELQKKKNNNNNQTMLTGWWNHNKALLPQCRIYILPGSHKLSKTSPHCTKGDLQEQDLVLMPNLKRSFSV